MEMKEVRCAKCGKPEMVPAEKADGCLSFEEAEQELLAGRAVFLFLCDKCAEEFNAFRKAIRN